MTNYDKLDLNKELVYKFYKVFVLRVSEKTSFKDCIKLSISKAYDDNKRVLVGVNKSGIDKERVEKLLIPKFLEYFKYKKDNLDEKFDFDSWHDKSCKDLIKIYERKGYVRVDKNGKKQEVGFTYGNAQKIINMAFKYLFCIMVDKNYGYEPLLKYFSDCHYVLDTYTIDYLCRKEKVKKISNIPWSKINQDTYLKYQEIARKHLDIPFYAEFIIWNNEIMQM